MQSLLLLASHVAAQQTFSYALRHQSAECSAQSQDLGIHFSPYLCALAAGEAGCTSFMFSSAYPSWRCRCCSRPDPGDAHSLWSVFDVIDCTSPGTSCETLATKLIDGVVAAAPSQPDRAGGSLHNQTAPSLIIERQTASFFLSGFPDGDEHINKSITRFSNQVLGAAQTWARRVGKFVVVVGRKSRPVLLHHGCSRSLKPHVHADSRSEVWTCKTMGVDGASPQRIMAVVTNCDDRLRFNGAIPYWYRYGCCKWDAAVRFALARPEFSRTRWFTISDDDVAFQVPQLLDYLRHYESSEPIIINPDATNLDDQRSGISYQHWNHKVKLCNPLIPQQVMGSVYSRGMLMRAGSNALQPLCREYQSDYDVVAPLLAYLRDAKFLPLSQGMIREFISSMSSNTFGFPGDTGHAAASQTFMHHKIVGRHQFSLLERNLELKYPAAELLRNPFGDDPASIAQACSSRAAATCPYSYLKCESEKKSSNTQVITTQHARNTQHATQHHTNTHAPRTSHRTPHNTHQPTTHQAPRKSYHV